MEQLKNVTISKAYKGKAGVNKFGPWQAWSVYLVDCETKFDYFEKGGIIPYDGMVLDMLEYEIKQNNEYTNYDIKRLVPRDTPSSTLPVPGYIPATHVLPARQTVPVGSKQEENKRLLMCTSYVKDIMVELIKKETAKVNMNSLGVLVDEIAKGSLKLVEKLTVLPPEKREAEKAKEGTPPPAALPNTVAPVLPVISTPAPVLANDIPF